MNDPVTRGGRPHLSVYHKQHPRNFHVCFAWRSECLSEFRILYVNANGLTETKYQYFIRLLDSNTLDIVAVAETWFPAFLGRNHSTHLAISSTCTRTSGMTGHPLGGVSLLLRPSDHHLLAYSSTLDSVTASTDSQTLTFAYFSPSLHKEDLILLLDSLPQGTLLMADFNIAFRKSSPKRTIF